MELVLFSIMGDCVRKIVCQFIWVCYLAVMFGIGFVCLWVGKYVIMPFNSREGVSVGLFNYRF